MAPKVIREEIGDEAANILDEEPYFVDFLRDAPEPTGDEPEDADMDAPKIYELVKRHAKSKKKLQMGFLLILFLKCEHVARSWFYFS